MAKRKENSFQLTIPMLPTLHVTEEVPEDLNSRGKHPSRKSPRTSSPLSEEQWTELHKNKGVTIRTPGLGTELAAGDGD